MGITYSDVLPFVQNTHGMREKKTGKNEEAKKKRRKQNDVVCNFPVVEN